MSALVLRVWLLVRWRAEVQSGQRALALRKRNVAQSGASAPLEVATPAIISAPLADPSTDVAADLPAAAGFVSRLAHGAVPVSERPLSVRVTAEEVLRWAALETMPSSRVRAATGPLPAGLEIIGAEAWIPTLRDGDRLVAIDGTPTTSYEQAFRLIVSAREAPAPAIVGRFARQYREQVVFFEVTIAQPY